MLWIANTPRSHLLFLLVVVLHIHFGCAQVADHFRGPVHPTYVRLLAVGCRGPPHAHLFASLACHLGRDHRLRCRGCLRQNVISTALKAHSFNMHKVCSCFFLEQQDCLDLVLASSSRFSSFCSATLIALSATGNLLQSTRPQERYVPEIQRCQYNCVGNTLRTAVSVHPPSCWVFWEQPSCWMKGW